MNSNGKKRDKAKSMSKAKQFFNGLLKAQSQFQSANLRRSSDSGEYGEGSSSRATAPSGHTGISLPISANNNGLSQSVPINSDGFNDTGVTFLDDYRRSESPARSVDSQYEDNVKLDLDACISLIESIIRNDCNGSSAAPTLTSEQKSAIEQLRSASSDHVDRQLEKFHTSNQQQRPRPQLVRSGGTLFMNKEMMESFNEVDTNEEDTDQQLSVHDVLSAFGGYIVGGFDNVKLFKKKMKIKVKKQKKRRSQEDAMNKSNVHYSDENTERADAIKRGPQSTSPNSQERNFTRFNTVPPMKSPPMVVASAINAPSLSVPDFMFSDANEESTLQPHTHHCPPEWNELTIEAKKKLLEVLSWENLSKWNFDVFEVTELSRQCRQKAVLDAATSSDSIGEQSLNNREKSCPLLFVGWAILCAPAAQKSMEQSIKTEENCGRDLDEKESLQSGESRSYNFGDHLKINPRTICNFLREIERRYLHENPYHNNIHAADVTQTLHCLIQFIGKQLIKQIFEPIEIFSVLLAATFHDVAHPGTNNLFQDHALTPVAIQYNNVSILENMHSAIGQSLLVGEEKQDEWDVMKDWPLDLIQRARGIMISSVLATDMSNHFMCAKELTSIIQNVNMMAEEIGSEGKNALDESWTDSPTVLITLAQYINAQNLWLEQSGLDSSEKEDDTETSNSKLKDECSQLASNLLRFMLHAADISNPSKPVNLSTQWTDRCLEEFFAQGDLEDEMMLPISPLCDRHTVKKPESQVGFLQFVVKPTYQLLAQVLPMVDDAVMPFIDKNLMHWKQRKSILSVQLDQIEEVEEEIERESKNS